MSRLFPFATPTCYCFCRRCRRMCCYTCGSIIHRNVQAYSQSTSPLYLRSCHNSPLLPEFFIYLWSNIIPSKQQPLVQVVIFPHLIHFHIYCVSSGKWVRVYQPLGASLTRRLNYFFFKLVVEHLLLLMYISLAKSVYLSSQDDLFHIINSHPLSNNNGAQT